MGLALGVILYVGKLNLNKIFKNWVGPFLAISSLFHPLSSPVVSEGLPSMLLCSDSLQNLKVIFKSHFSDSPKRFLSGFKSLYSLWPQTHNCHLILPFFLNL